MLKVFCIYDSKVESYMNPFCCSALGEAIRGFTELANDSNSNICKYASDFTLFELGSYDPATAKFVLHSTVLSRGCAIEFKDAVKAA